MDTSTPLSCGKVTPTRLILRAAFQRFISKVKISETLVFNGTPCWEWQGAKSGYGYGCFYIDGGKTSPHRYIYFYWIGQIPNGKEIDHLCNNRICCNPVHLEAVTKSENHLRAYQRGRIHVPRVRPTHCPHGHEYTESNAHVNPNGTLQCKECWRANNRRRSKLEKLSRHERLT